MDAEKCGDDSPSLSMEIAALTPILLSNSPLYTSFSMLLPVCLRLTEFEISQSFLKLRVFVYVSPETPSDLRISDCVLTDISPVHHLENGILNDVDSTACR